jgi:acetolactate synthase small subunit
MYAFVASPSDTRQYFWLDADSDALCRVLGLYAARGLRIARLDYEPHSTGVGRLTVTAEGAEDVLRILVAKAASLVGVVCAHAAQEVLQIPSSAALARVSCFSSAMRSS